jgi:hypothetical protein
MTCHVHGKGTPLEAAALLVVCLSLYAHWAKNRLSTANTVPDSAIVSVSNHTLSPYTKALAAPVRTGSKFITDREIQTWNKGDGLPGPYAMLKSRSYSRTRTEAPDLATPGNAILPYIRNFLTTTHKDGIRVKAAGHQGLPSTKATFSCKSCSF